MSLLTFNVRSFLLNAFLIYTHLRQASKPGQMEQGIRQIAEQTGWAIYSQTQKVTSVEITSRSQLYFSARPREVSKPRGQRQDQLQWLMTPTLALTNQWRPWPCTGIPGKMVNILLKQTLSWDLPKTPDCKKEIFLTSSLTDMLLLNSKGPETYNWEQQAAGACPRLFPWICV